MTPEDKVTYFAETDFRNQKTKFGIKEKDRTRHMYIIGKTGMGKSTMLENLAIQDIQNGEGLIFIDPHGSAASKLLEYVPKHRVDDVIYLNPADADFPLAFNVLEDVPKNKRNSVASGLMNAFKKIWVDAWSSRMEYLLNYTLLALLDVPETTLLSINRLLSDKSYRDYILERVEDTIVKSFWQNEFTKYNDKYATEAVAPIQNKVGQFISNPLMRNIIGQEDSSIDFRKVMDEKKILIINLSKGLIGPDNMRLIGGMLITKIFLAALSRADMTDDEIKRMPTCHLYVDEFQNFANESFAEILSESRKYKLALTVANQYIEQMTDEVKSAIFGNVGSLVSFRVGATDAEFLEKEFAPYFTAEDLVNLGFTQNYLKLMIDGVGSKPFSSSSMAPIAVPEITNVLDIIAASRDRFTRPKEEVEEKIKTWNETAFGKTEKPRERRSDDVRDFKKPTTEPQQPRPNITFTKKEDIQKPAEIKTTQVVQPKRDFVKKDDRVEKIDTSKSSTNSVNFGDLIKKAMSESSDVEKIKSEVVEKKQINQVSKIQRDLSEKTDLQSILKKEIRNTADLPVRNIARQAAKISHLSSVKSDKSGKPKLDYISDESQIPKKDSEVPEDVLRALLEDLVKE